MPWGAARVANAREPPSSLSSCPTPCAPSGCHMRAALHALRSQWRIAPLSPAAPPSPMLLLACARFSAARHSSCVIRSLLLNSRTAGSCPAQAAPKAYVMAGRRLLAVPVATAMAFAGSWRHAAALCYAMVLPDDATANPFSAKLAVTPTLISASRTIEHNITWNEGGRFCAVLSWLLSFWHVVVPVRRCRFARCLP